MSSVPPESVAQPTRATLPSRERADFDETAIGSACCTKEFSIPLCPVHDIVQCGSDHSLRRCLYTFFTCQQPFRDKTKALTSRNRYSANPVVIEHNVIDSVLYTCHLSTSNVTLPVHTTVVLHVVYQ